MSISVGQPAPDFTLVNSEKEEITLSGQKGSPVLLLFFPLAFTGVCTKELCGVRDSISQYNNLNAKIFGISVDTPFVLAKFKEENGLNFSLLSDFNKTASAAYDAQYEEFVLGLKGVAKRSAFVVDAEGIVRYAEVLESAGDLPDFEAIKATLKSLN